MEKKKNKQLRNLILVLSASFAISTPLVALRNDGYVNHTADVCNITKFLNKHFYSENELSLGDKHQIKQMKKEYQKQGENVTVKRDPNYPIVVVKKETTEAEIYKLSNGTTAYIVPEGFGYKDGLIEYKEDLIEKYVAQEIINDSYVTTFEDGTQKVLTRP